MSHSMHGVDTAWLATDSRGCIGVFFTGGQGPIPPQAFAVLHSGFQAEDQALALPEVGGHDLLVKYQRPDDFVAFAKRGLFAFDWSDVHRTLAQGIGVYELVAQPILPAKLSDLPESIQRAARAVLYSNISFQDCGQYGVHVVGA